jgi:hypothetical protein
MDSGLLLASVENFEMCGVRYRSKRKILSSSKFGLFFPILLINFPKNFK